MVVCACQKQEEAPKVAEKKKPAVSASQPAAPLTVFLDPITATRVELPSEALEGTGATDRGLQALSTCSALRAVLASDTAVTEAGAAVLRQVLPETRVVLHGEAPSPEAQ